MAYRLDHLVIVAADLERALAEQGARFGRGPDWRASSDGTETAEWRTRTGAVEVLVPPSAAALEPASTGPKSLVLGVDDIQRARANLLAAGLQPGSIARAEASDARTGERRAWQRLRCADAVLGGLKLFVVQREGALDPLEGPDLERTEPGDLATLPPPLTTRMIVRDGVAEVSLNHRAPYVYSTPISSRRCVAPYTTPVIHST